MRSDPAAAQALRRTNWIAIACGTVVMMVSYFSYAAAFVDEVGENDSFDIGFAAVGLALAPLVFVVVGFVSKNAQAPKHVLLAMLLLLGVGLSIGLVDPLVGAATGFCAGGAVALQRPQVERVAMWRTAAVVFTSVYCLLLLVLAGPAGVFSGAVIPLVMIGFADEYATWSDQQSAFTKGATDG